MFQLPPEQCWTHQHLLLSYFTQTSFITSISFSEHNISLSSSGFSRLDYFNVFFIGKPTKNLQLLQYVQNSAAQVLSTETQMCVTLSLFSLDLHHCNNWIQDLPSYQSSCFLCSAQSIRPLTRQNYSTSCFIYHICLSCNSWKHIHLHLNATVSFLFWFSEISVENGNCFSLLCFSGTVAVSALKAIKDIHLNTCFSLDPIYWPGTFIVLYLLFALLND